MQEIVKAMGNQKTGGGGEGVGGEMTRGAKQVKILTPDVEDDEIIVGPALFGPELGRNEFQVRTGMNL